MSQRLIAFSRFLVGIALVYTAHVMASFLSPATLSFRRFDLVYRPLLMLLLLAGFSVLLTGFDRFPGNPLAAMGLALRSSWKRDLWAGSLLGAGMVAVTVAAIAIRGTLTIRVVASSHSFALTVIVVLILATGAVAEEFAFRGYPFQRLIEAIGPMAASIVLSLLFGAVHLLNPHASAWGYLNTALIGFLLSVAYLRTRLLWFPIAVHFGWNFTLGFLFGLPVSGLTEFSVVTRARAEGPWWLTGGHYGIEASAVGGLVVAAGVVLLLLFMPQRAEQQSEVGQGAPELPVAEQELRSSEVLTPPDSENDAAPESGNQAPRTTGNAEVS